MKSNDTQAPLESILQTDELKRRPPRVPDYAAENRTLVALTQALADAPETVLQTLAEEILGALRAGSAGVSLLGDNEERFYWPAIAGRLQAHVGGSAPRGFSPCSDVIDCNAPLLLTQIKRRYPYFETVTPPVEECLLVPFYVAGKAVGTLWAVAHDNIRKFDGEDLRLLENLGRLASAVFHTQTIGAREKQRENQAQKDAIEASLVLANVVAKLRTSEALNHSIVESSLDCIKILDLEGGLKKLLCGKAMLGIDDIEPYLNTSWLDFWGPEDRLSAVAAVASAAAGRAGHFVGFFRTLRGEPKWWEVAISPIRGANGKPERLLSVSRDVTARKQQEMNLAILAAVSHDLALWTNVDEMMRNVGAKMGAHFNLSVCAFAEIDEAAERVVISHDWHRQDVPGLVGVYRLADFVAEEFTRLARTGEAIVVRDTERDPRTSDEKFAALKIASFICIPLIRNEQWCFALCLYRSEPHDWRHHEIELARELAARIWTRLERLRAEEALRAREEKYRDLFNSMDEGLCVIEMIFDAHNKPIDYRYLEVNASFTKHSGMHNTIGKRVLELLPNIETYWLELYGKVALTGEPIRYKNKVEALDERWMDVYAFRLGGPTSQKVAVLFTDITERTRTADALRQSEQRFRALFDRGPIAMYSCDAFGAIREFNRVAMDLWGLNSTGGNTTEHSIGSFKTFLADGTPLQYTETPMIKVLRGVVPEVRDMEMVIERPDGSRVNVIANIVPLKNEQSEITGAINCFYDITERSRLEKHAHKQAEALADLHRRKDEFLAMLSHELRNPLAPISNAVLLLRLQKQDDPIQAQARGIIERQVGQLTRLIDDLMEVSRISTGRIHLREERLAFNDIVENAVETVRPLIEKHQHSLEVALSIDTIWLHADAARLEQVVVNLISNATKYTEPGGSIRISLQREGNDAILRVRDSGVGIAPEFLPHIFEIFTQAERSLARSEGGLGIGLCLVKRLVEMHSGRVDAYSTLGKGSEFVVRLPVIATLPPSVVSCTETVKPVGGSLQVLLIEDNFDAAETMALVLETFGHDVRTAHDGLSGLEVAIEFQPQVVLMDIGLPGIDGFEVAKRLRLQPTLKNIVLVAMTGYGESIARQRSKEAGFDHHLVKPADFSKLQEILSNASVDLANNV